MKNSVAFAAPRWDGMSGRRASFPSVRRTSAFAAKPVLLPLLVGELVTAIALFASGGIPPVLVRTLQIFLRF